MNKYNQRHLTRQMWWFIKHIKILKSTKVLTSHYRSHLQSIIKCEVEDLVDFLYFNICLINHYILFAKHVYWFLIMFIYYTAKILKKKLFENSDLALNVIYILSRQVITDTNLHIFQHKLLLNSLHFNYMLYKFGKVVLPHSFLDGWTPPPILFLWLNPSPSFWSKLILKSYPLFLTALQIGACIFYKMLWNEGVTFCTIQVHWEYHYHYSLYFQAHLYIYCWHLLWLDIAFNVLYIWCARGMKMKHF